MDRQTVGRLLSVPPLYQASASGKRANENTARLASVTALLSVTSITPAFSQSLCESYEVVEMLRDGDTVQEVAASSSMSIDMGQHIRNQNMNSGSHSDPDITPTTRLLLRGAQ
jgi:hypothetical protein